MQKVIYVWNYREWGGAQIYFLSLMKEARKGFDVTALIPSDSEPKILQYLRSLEIPVEFLPPTLSLRNQNGLIGKLKTRVAIVRSEDLLVRNILARQDLSETIIHIDLGFWHSFLSLLRLCRKTNVFLTVHTGLPSYKGWRKWRWKIKGQLLSCFSSFHLLASNYEAKDSLKSYIGSEKYDQLEVTYSGIDPDEITHVEAELSLKTGILQRYTLPNDKPILMTVGQFIERKGCWVLLESLKQLKGNGDNVLFVWLSTTMPDAETQKRIDAYGLGTSFRLMDSEEIGETRKDMLTLLSVADIFILASLQEGLPIALIEAMALGLPCIATNVNAIPEAVINNHTGILIEPNNAFCLSEAITDLLSDPQQREILGKAARKIAYEKFNSTRSSKRTLELYYEVWQTPA